MPPFRHRDLYLCEALSHLSIEDRIITTLSEFIQKFSHLLYNQPAGFSEHSITRQQLCCNRFLEKQAQI